MILRTIGQKLTKDFLDDIAHRDPPDFVVGFDGRAVGIELAEIRRAEDAWDYYAEAYRLASQKHESYARRDLFQKPMILVLHSNNLPLYEIKSKLMTFDSANDFGGLGFAEVWAVDLSEVYHIPGHPLRPADMFCFKPQNLFGFHRIGSHGRKPFG